MHIEPLSIDPTEKKKKKKKKKKKAPKKKKTVYECTSSIN